MKLTWTLLENSANILANGIFDPQGVGLGLDSMSLTYPENTRTWNEKIIGSQIFKSNEEGKKIP